MNGQRHFRMVHRHHEIFGQWHVPNQRVYVPHERGFFVVRTNGEGMRASREYSRQAAPGTRRILLFGDSFSAGEGVHNEERFSDRLERSLHGWETLNFALNGSGTDQQLLIFENLGKAFEGDVLLVCPQVENIRRVGLTHWPILERTTGRVILIPKPYFTLEEGGLRLHHVPVPKERMDPEDAPANLRAVVKFAGRPGLPERALRHLEPFKPALMRVSRYQPFPQYDSPKSPGWRLTQAILERFIEAAGERTVLLAPLPLFYHIEGLARPSYLDRYREFVGKHPRIHLVDLLPYFRKLTPAERRRCRFSQDIHYTPEAHRLVADALRSEILRRGIPSSSRSRQPAEVA